MAYKVLDYAPNMVHNIPRGSDERSHKTRNRQTVFETWKACEANKCTPKHTKSLPHGKDNVGIGRSDKANPDSKFRYRSLKEESFLKPK